MNTTRSANDNARTRNPFQGAGKDVRTAVATMRRAIAAGNVKTARKAAIYAVPRLFAGMALPTSDDLAVWGLVLRAVEAQAATLDAEAVAARSAVFA